MKPSVFLTEFSSTCAKHKVDVKDLVKIATTMAQQPEQHPVSNLAGMATGAAPVQLQNDSLSNLLQSINDVGRYGKPLQPRQPFSN